LNGWSNVHANVERGRSKEHGGIFESETADILFADPQVQVFVGLGITSSRPEPTTIELPINYVL